MFTGLVEATGVLVRSESVDGDQRLSIGSALFTDDLALGESVAVNGACLTVTSITPARGDKAAVAAFDVSLETLWLTTLGDLRSGEEVNLERALRADSRLGGHLVTGHVDGVGVVRQIESSARSTIMHIAAPRELMGYLARKGSVCVQGVSLTINTVERDTFAVNLVPHTLQATTLHRLAVEARVNLEVDMLARYLEQLVLRNHDVAARLRGRD